jgi:hypothetical protein
MIRMIRNMEIITFGASSDYRLIYHVDFHAGITREREVRT